MELAKMEVSRAEIRKVHRGKLTSGMVGAEIAFSFDDAWDGLNRIAVFKAGGTVKDVLLIGESCVIPHEVLERPVHLVVGVYGTAADGSVVIPTVWADLGMVERGAKPSGESSTKPTPEVWARILGMIGDLKKLNTEDKSSLVAAINEVLRKGADPEEVERIVGAYLAENGIGGGIHIGPYPPDDPNVDIWLDTSEEETPPYIPNTINAKPGQIVRVVTVDENGAITAVEAVDMPSGGERYELPAAAADVLGGVKAEPATEADTQPVRIGENGMLYTAPGGGVPGNGETVAAPLPLLADVTSEEALSHFEVTLSKRAVRRVLVQISVPASEAMGGACYGALNGGGWDAIIFGNTALAANAKKWMELELMEGGLAKYTVSESSGNLWNLNTIRTAGALEKISYVDSIGIRLLGQNTAPAGTRLQVWGE